MKNLFRLAIVGAGQITATAHLPAALASTRVELVALIDPVVERARRLAWEYGIRARVTSSVQDVLGEVDGALIATPNHTHCELAIQCLEAGVPVLIEKPLAVSVSQGEAIVRAADEHQTIAAVGYSQRFMPSVRLMHALLNTRYFGAIRSFAYQVGAVGGWAPVSGYNLDRNATGGGVLVVSGTHFIDRMLYWFGYPEDFEHQDDSAGGPEANSISTFRYTNGGSHVDGTVRFSKTVPLQEGFVMETEHGIVVQHHGQPIRVRPRTNPSLEITVQERAGELQSTDKSIFQLQLEDFVEAVQQNSAPMSTAREALESVRLIEALYARRTSMKADWYNHGAGWDRER
jgi:predicted dehydrogenase